MKISIHTPKILVRNSLLGFVMEKVKKLGDLSTALMEARVTLRLEKTPRADGKICEIKGLLPGSDLFAAKRADSFEVATLRAIDAIKKQITDRMK